MVVVELPPTGGRTGPFLVAFAYLISVGILLGKGGDPPGRRTDNVVSN